MARFLSAKLSLSADSRFARPESDHGATREFQLGTFFNLPAAEIGAGAPQLRWTVKLRPAGVPYARLKQKFPGFYTKKTEPNEKEVAEPAEEPAAHAAEPAEKLSTDGKSVQLRVVPKILLNDLTDRDSGAPVIWDSGGVFINGDQAQIGDFFTVLDATDPADPDAGGFPLLIIGQARWKRAAPTPLIVKEEIMKVNQIVQDFLPDQFKPAAGKGSARCLLVFYYPLVAASTKLCLPLATTSLAHVDFLILDKERFRRHLGPSMIDVAQFFLQDEL